MSMIGVAPSHSRHSGFTLVEVLVALVVLSIGMLGIAALYLESLRGGRAALYRTQAVNMAADIADRMRANRNPTDAYDCGGACAATMGGNAQAIADISAWLDNVNENLPGGTGSITYTAPTGTTPTIYMVTLSWTEVGYTTPLTYAMRVEI
jgi:type IV pilus assembly protein PilV